MSNHNTDKHEQLLTVLNEILQNGQCSLTTLEQSNRVSTRLKELVRFIGETYSNTLLRVTRHPNEFVRKQYAKETAFLIASLVELVDLIFQYGDETSNVFLNKLTTENNRIQNHCNKSKNKVVTPITTTVSQLDTKSPVDNVAVDNVAVNNVAVDNTLISLQNTTDNKVLIERGRYREKDKWVYALKVCTPDTIFFVDTKFGISIVTSKNKQVKIAKNFIFVDTDKYQAINRILNDLQTAIESNRYVLNKKTKKLTILRKGGTTNV